MADPVKVKLLRPLDGQPEGGEAFYSEADARRLQARGLVQIVKAETKAAPAPRNKAEPAPKNKSA